MGCLLACFGSSKAEKRRKQRRKVLSRECDQRSSSSKPEQLCVTSVPDYSKPDTLTPTSEIQSDKPEEQSSLSTRKKVTFDSNVKTYEPVLLDEITDFPLEDSEESGKKEEILVKSSQSKSSSDASSVTSTGSYPPNSRYQNCRESDDEDEELDYEVGDLSDEDDLDDDSDIEEELDEEFEDGDIAYTRARTSAAQIVDEEEVKSPIPIGMNPNARDRSVYVHPVLNPVENITQWKAVKAKRRTPQPLMPSQKENSISNTEHCVPLSSKQSFKERSFSSKQEIAVDASLSNWLGSSIAMSERSTSESPNSVISHEDRPILGALTVEELKQFSASNSPMKSPRRSPDEMPIIGTVGTYWNHKGSVNCVEDSGSVSSFKGIPNTTSKYEEDKRVNWYSTPFETRIERALNRGSADAASTHVPSVF